jgi:hypothetical protein
MCIDCSDAEPGFKNKKGEGGLEKLTNRVALYMLIRIEHCFY